MGYIIGRLLLIVLIIGTGYCTIQFVLNAPSWVLYLIGAIILLSVWDELA